MRKEEHSSLWHRSLSIFWPVLTILVSSQLSHSALASTPLPSDLTSFYTCEGECLWVLDTGDLIDQGNLQYIEVLKEDISDNYKACAICISHIKKRCFQVAHYAGARAILQGLKVEDPHHIIAHCGDKPKVEFILPSTDALP